MALSKSMKTLTAGAAGAVVLGGSPTGFVSGAARAAASTPSSSSVATASAPLPAGSAATSAASGHLAPRHLLQYRQAAGVAAAGLLAASSAVARRGFRSKASGRAVACRAAGETIVGKSDAGLDTVTLKRGDSEALVYLLGGLVASYKVGGHDWLAVRPDAKLDGSKPISGGLTHCFPQFGPGKIQQHGFARNLPWKLVEGASSDGVAVLELTDNEETRKMWPYAFRLTMWVELKDDALDTTLRVENLSDEEFDFTLALHSYYSCSKVDDLTIEGPFLGKSKLDKTKDPAEISSATSDVVKIGAFTEEIYRDVLPGNCRLTDPAKGSLDIINGGGWKDVVVWNPYGDEGMGYEGFVCCESAGLTPVVCPPKGTWDATMRLVANPK